MVLQDGSTMTLSEKETRKMILNFQPTKHFQKGDEKLTQKKGGILFLRMLTKGLKAEQWHQIDIPFSTIFALSMSNDSTLHINVSQLPSIQWKIKQRPPNLKEYSEFEKVSLFLYFYVFCDPIGN